MLDILKQKLSSWTPTAANELYGQTNRIADELFTNAIWEASPTGVFLISPDVTMYQDFSGVSYYLSLGDHIVDLEQKLAMSEYAEANDLTRIEKPIEFYTTVVEGVVYTYSKERTPYTSQGSTIENLVLVPPSEIVNSVKEVFKEFLKGCNDLLLCIQNVPDATYTQGIAKDTFRFDPIAGKFFFAGPIYFGKTQEQFTADARAMNQANMLDNFLQQRYKITDSIQGEIYSFAEQECLTLQQLM